MLNCYTLWKCFTELCPGGWRNLEAWLKHLLWTQETVYSLRKVTQKKTIIALFTRSQVTIPPNYFFFFFHQSEMSQNVSSYGSKSLGKIMAYLMTFFLNLCDWSVTYCASLEAWYWIVAGQHLNAIIPDPQFAQIQLSLYFQTTFFLKL